MNMLCMLSFCLSVCEAVVTINTLWLEVLLSVSVSFWFVAWEEKKQVGMSRRNPADAVTWPLLFFGYIYTASNCCSTQEGLTDAEVER